jgi:hypothetical protein
MLLFALPHCYHCSVLCQLEVFIDLHAFLSFVWKFAYSTCQRATRHSFPFWFCHSLHIEQVRHHRHAL